MSEHLNDIDQILNDFKKQKEEKENNTPKKETQEPITSTFIEEPIRSERQESAVKAELKKELIDFSKDSVDAKAREKSNKKIKRKKASDFFALLKRIFINKTFLIGTLIIALALAIGCGVNYGIEQSKTSYLDPYREQYPDVTFPEGILEQYCDTLGQNPELKGILKIDSMGIDMQIDGTALYPITEGATYHNYVIKLDNNDFEKLYSTAQAYNNADKEIFFTDLTKNYTFEVVGAFYTNTKPEDDDGYVFPYNVTEEMTFDSTNQFIDRLNSRFLYTVKALDIARQDTLLTIECPTDYKDGYRFVVVCKEVEEIDNNATAIEKEQVHKTASEYENEADNPYRFAADWYPEIIVTDKNGIETTIQKTIDDYLQ